MPRGLFQPTTKKQNKKTRACMKQCTQRSAVDVLRPSDTRPSDTQPALRRTWREKKIDRDNGHKVHEETSFYVVRRSAKRVAEYEALKKKFEQMKEGHPSFCYSCEWGQCLVELYYDIAYFFINDNLDEYE